MAAVLALCAAAPAGAGAEGVDALLSRIEKRLYHPMDDGLKDLSATIQSDMVRETGEGEGPRIRFYWKAPGRRRVRFEGMERLPAAARPYLTLAETQIRGFAFLALREKFTAMKADYDLEARPDGDFMKLTARRKPDAKAADRADLAVFWIDAQDRVVRVMSRAGTTESEAAMTYIEKDGRWLQDSITLRSAQKDAEAPETRVTFDHTQVGAFWLVTRIRYAVGDRPSSLVFEDLRANEGVDDAVFDDK
jgi:outer membrane lipoprotein-sorting protein